MKPDKIIRDWLDSSLRPRRQKNCNITRLGGVVYPDSINATGMAIRGGYAYLASTGDGICIYDVHDPATPAEVGRYRPSGTFRDVSGPVIDDPCVNGIVIAGDNAYVPWMHERKWESRWWIGMQILELSDPSAPVVVSSCEFIDDGSQGCSLFVRGNRAYLVSSNADLRILDISDRTQPKVIGTYRMERSSSAGEGSYPMAAKGEHLYIADRGVRLLDIGNPALPVEVGYFDFGHGHTPGLSMMGNIAYLAHGRKGLHIIDVSNPSEFLEVSHYTSLGQASAIDICGEHLCVVDGEEGYLRVIDVSDPTAPLETGFHQIFSASSLVVCEGNYAYVAGAEDFGIYDCSAALKTRK